MNNMTHTLKIQRQKLIENFIQIKVWVIYNAKTGKRLQKDNCKMMMMTGKKITDK